MSEPDQHIALQRQTIAAMHHQPGRADLRAILDEVGLNLLVMVEVLQRSDPEQGPTMSPDQWARECRGLWHEQAPALERMRQPGWPHLQPREYLGGIVHDAVAAVPVTDRVLV